MIWVPQTRPNESLTPECCCRHSAITKVRTSDIWYPRTGVRSTTTMTCR
jgi:hypothetical protein